MASPSLPPPHEPLTLAGLAPWLLTVVAGAFLWSARVVVGQQLKAIADAFSSLKAEVLALKLQIEKVDEKQDELLDSFHALSKESAVYNQRITALESRVRQLEADQRNRHSA